MKDYADIARLCNADLGRDDITAAEVRTYCLTNRMPDRLTTEEASDFRATVIKELDVGGMT